MSEYRLVVIPDVILSDGRVRHWTLYDTILRNRRRAFWVEVARMKDAADEEKRDFTLAEQHRLGQLMTEIMVLDKEITGRNG